MTASRRCALFDSRCERRCFLRPRSVSVVTMLLVLIIGCQLECCTARHAFADRDGIAAFSSTSEDDDRKKNRNKHFPRASFGSFIRQQQMEALEGGTIMDDMMNDNNNNFKIKIPKELDVTSPPIAGPASGDSTRQTGNPQIYQEVPIDFQMTLSIVQGIEKDFLLEDLQSFLEFYLARRYQLLIDQQNSEFALASPNLSLENVDLVVSPVERRRRLARGREIIEVSTSRLRGRVQEGRSLQDASELWKVDVEGEVAYTVEVDGGSPTPKDIEDQWTAALQGFISQPVLQQVMLGASIEGVVGVEQVEIRSMEQELDTGDSNTPTQVETSANNTENVSTTNGGTPWQDSATVDDSSSSDLVRPSTLSIVFGFVLTGIAALGLVGYCYVFYRKRKKRLRKKRQMKESISFPPAGSATSKINRNSSTVSSRPASSPSPSSQAVPAASPPVITPMILSPVDDTFSEESSYKGLESSVASEEASDAFAKELQRAASLDQQAWDEFQRKKEALDNNQAVRASNVDKQRSYVDNQESPASNPAALKVASLSPPGRRDELVEDDGIILADTVEDDEKAQLSWAKSFPYGDEVPDDEYDDDEWVENPTTPRTSRFESPRARPEQWEPYNSALPPSPVSGILEEKKDEASPTGFFAKQLRDIEMDLERYGSQSNATSPGDAEAPLGDDEAVDILSEVEELSRYVRRYEQRKDRRTKREMELHERLSVGGGSSSTPSAATMSIGMDGRVYNPYHDNSPRALSTTTSSTSSMSPIQPPPGQERGREVSSYAGSYLSNHLLPSGSGEDLSFVSDDEEAGSEELETSVRSQRLGISPFSVSQPDEEYNDSNPKKEELSTRTPAVSTRIATSRSSDDDYRYAVGYGYGYGNFNPAETSMSSRSSNSTSRLADLRKNNAIIDSSDSDVNVPYDPYTTQAALNKTPPSDSGKKESGSKKDGGFGLRGFLRANNNSNSSSGSSSRPKKTANNRFDRLRGMFEQKTNDQPEPIYPPGENWQYEGHTKRKNGR